MTGLGIESNRSHKFKASFNILLAVIIVGLLLVGAVGCPRPTRCEWNPVTITWTGGSAGTETISCGETYSPAEISSCTTFSINSSVKCMQSDCPNRPKYKWSITKILGDPEGPWHGSGLPASFTPTSGGKFKVVLNVSCCGKKCPNCTIYIWFDGVDYDCIDPPSGLIAWWPLDSTDMINPDCSDIVGPYDGLISCGNPEPVAGKVDEACRFSMHPANSGRIRTLNFSDPFMQIGEGDFTIDAWIFPESPGPNLCGLSNGFEYCKYRTIIDNGESGNRIWFFVKDDHWDDTTNQWASMSLGFSVRLDEFLATSVPIVHNQWQHVAVTVSRTSGNNIGIFYLNGLPIDTFIPPPSWTGVNLYDQSATAIPKLFIGHDAAHCGWCPDDSYFNGLLDEIEIFDRALDTSEIAAIYCAGNEGKCKPPACSCRNWSQATVTWQGDAPWTHNISCGGNYTIDWIYAGTNISVDSSISCSSGCNASYSWLVTDSQGASWSGVGLPVSFPASPGSFTLALTAYCGEQICLPCIIYINIEDINTGPCSCLNWSQTTVTWSGGSQNVQCLLTTVPIVQIPSITSGMAVEIDSSITCSPSCNASYTWSITDPQGATWSGTGLPVSFIPTSSGTFSVTLTASCGGTFCRHCPMDIYIGNISTSTSTPTTTPTSTPMPTPTPTCPPTNTSFTSSQPTLLGPIGGQTIPTNQPVFNWCPVAGATNYHIQVATDPGFGAADIVIDEALGNVQSYLSGSTLASGTYYWHVKAINTITSEESLWSNTESFIVP